MTMCSMSTIAVEDRSPVKNLRNGASTAQSRAASATNHGPALYWFILFVFNDFRRVNRSYRRLSANTNPTARLFVIFRGQNRKTNRYSVIKHHSCDAFCDYFGHIVKMGSFTADDSPDRDQAVELFGFRQFLENYRNFY